MLALDTPPGRPAAAALRLLQAPAPVRVRLGRAGLEAFRHGATWHDVTAWSGPERLVPRWWVRDTAPESGALAASPAFDARPTAALTGMAAHRAPLVTATAAPAGPRDYYSARSADGALWLLFRDGASRRWFVEGWWD